MFSKPLMKLIVVALFMSNFFCGSARRDSGRGSLDCEAHGQAFSVWNEEVQTRLDIPLKILDGNLEASEAELVKDKLDRFTSEWEELNKAVCRDYRDNKIDKDVLEKKLGCLSSAVERQEEIVSALDLHERDAVEQIDSLENALGPCREDYR